MTVFKIFNCWGSPKAAKLFQVLKTPPLGVIGLKFRSTKKIGKTFSGLQIFWSKKVWSKKFLVNRNLVKYIVQKNV